MVLVAACRRQEGTGGGVFWTISLKQVEKCAGARSEARLFFLDVRLSFCAALYGGKDGRSHHYNSWCVHSITLLIHMLALLFP